MIQAGERLTSAAIGGDRDALRDLLRRHDQYLRGHVASKIRATHRAAFDEDDVLQVTYLEAYLRIRQFNPNGPGSFRAWLLRITENNLQDAIRSLNCRKRPPRDKQVSIPAGDESYVTLLSLLGGTATTPTTHLRRAETKSLLEQALGKLPPDYETVVRLSDLAGRSMDDVANAMGRTAASVRMLKARAHARLSELLGSPSRF